jgi:hypothetical protein
MGTNPSKEKTPNRDMAREMGNRDDDEKPQDVHMQKMGIDPQIPGPAPTGLGTNFTRGTKSSSRTDKDSE